MMRRFRAVPVALLAVSVLVAGARLHGQAPSSSDASNSRGADVDALFQGMAKPSSPGCSLGVMRSGRLVYARGYGMANLDHDVVNTPSTVFHVASISKQFTAAAIVLLEEDGKLSLDDEVRKYVPELPDFGQRITIRHLVHHTSGLRDQWDLLGLAGWRYSRDLITDDDVLQVMARQKALNFAPGSEHLYCNTGYTLLATIAARASGKSFREFTTERLFKPLGMTRTHFRDDFGEIVKDQAYGYVPAGNAFRLSVTNFDTAGATSLLTTVEDMARWDLNFIDGRVGGPRFLKEILTRGRLNSGEEIAYAYGLGHASYRGLATIGHSGGDAGYRSDYLQFPTERFSVVCLCNLASADPAGLTRKVADIFLADRLGPADRSATDGGPAVTVSEQDLARFAGLYWQRGTENFRKVSAKDGTLRVGFGEGATALKAVAANGFTGRGWDLRFDTVAAGMRLTETARSGSAKPVVYEAVEEVVPNPDERAAYVGAYRSEEIDQVYHVAAEGGRLVMRRLKYPPQALEPMTRDVFRAPSAVVRFVRDDKGRVAGCELTTGRVRRLRFARVQEGK